MIKLVRGIKPDILNAHHDTWQVALDAAIQKYGSYKNIPKKEKDSLLSHYRHQDIKDILFATSKLKCAFCECKPTEGGNIEVEHFKPKSIYPEFAFEWLNFLPSCNKCNNSKLNHDTGKLPIVNPYETDPEDVFYYEDIRIRPVDGNKLGNTTIEVCGLNTVRLMTPRGQLLASLHEFAYSMEEALNDYHSCSTELTKMNRLRKISSSIDSIEELTKSSSKYSAYCSHYLRNCQSYIDAKKLIRSAME
ncbi:HNH endonuclease [Vibrio sp. 99K-1]|uniref:HNH endonuclease n=1 Tax=Vibrio sp. 99K-1 TaxID=2607603 RepID=UPI0014938445|nr:HNH endonuclease [Vibrio sp. 99K-1]NOI85078.1 HNH endonuclease [Vibrio sp. 99K-1]